MPVRTPLFLLARCPSKSSPVTLLGNRQVRLLSWNNEIVGKFLLLLSMPRFCSR